MGRFLIGAWTHLWRSPWTTWVGLRYLKSKKNSQFLSFITILSVLGVGIGVSAIIVVLSVMDGFEQELKNRLMATDVHVVIEPTSQVETYSLGRVPKDALDDHLVQKIFRDDPRIVNVWPMVTAEAILRSGTKVTGIMLKGVGKARMKSLNQQMVESAEPQMLMERRQGKAVRLPGIFVGQEMAYEMGVIPGDFVTLISPTETQGLAGTVPRLKRFVVEGVYSSGLPDQEIHTVFTQDKNVYSFIRKRNVVSQWEVTVKDFDTAPDVGARIQKALPNYRVQDWIQLNQSLFFSLRLERFAMFIVMIFIIVVASFNIVTTLTLMVLEKKKEIAIFKAMGARSAQVASIFLAEGLLIGALGAGGGTAVAWVICMMLRQFEFISLPDVYYDRTLPVTFDPFYYGVVGGTAFVIVLVACIYPSWRASRLHPLEGIRS